jgi:hypothetical protein
MCHFYYQGGKMSKFFEQLKEGLEEVLAHKKGQITLRSETIEIPEPPADYTTKTSKTSVKEH